MPVGWYKRSILQLHGQARGALIWAAGWCQAKWKIMQPSSEMLAGLLAGAASLALLLGALIFQYAGGLPPCEMCHWQRWPHIAAAFVGLGGAGLGLAGAVPRSLTKATAVFAIAALALSGLIGIYHAGVEWMLWEGPTACSGLGFDPGAPSGPDAFRIVRCDVAAWRLLGISLAGYNAMFSLGAAALCLMLLRRKR
jgi:disulfide bond formation protein DsbB